MVAADTTVGCWSSRTRPCCCAAMVVNELDVVLLCCRPIDQDLPPRSDAQFCQIIQLVLLIEFDVTIEFELNLKLAIQLSLFNFELQLGFKFNTDFIAVRHHQFKFNSCSSKQTVQR